jgi:hypothetical protein
VGSVSVVGVEVIQNAPQLAGQHFYQALRNVRFVEVANIKDVGGNALERSRDGFGEDEIVETAG